MKRLSTLVLTCGLLLCPFAVAQPPASPASGAKAAPTSATSERWYVLTMQGQRAGYLKSVETTAGDRVTSSSDMHLEIKRGAIAIKVQMQTEFVETTGGKPVSMSSNQVLGAMATKSVTTFSDEAMVTTTTVGNQTTTKTSPVPEGAWLTPAAGERYVKSELAKGAKEITLKTIDPTVGEGLITVTRRVVESDGTVEVFGKTVPAVKWESTVDKYPGVKQSEYVAPSGDVLKSVTNLGGIVLEQLAADKDLAMSKLDAPELLESTTVKPDRPLTNPRHLSKATYRVSVENEDMPDLPTVAGQRFTRESPTSGTVQQDATGTEPVAPADLAGVRAKHLEASSTLKSDDPEIVALVKKASVDGLKSAEATEKLRGFVHSFIRTKDMSVGFATASEVARTRTGDCTEHAVLLAAMLRANGIASRCASGLVYVEQFGNQKGIFGYHMWTQALVEQQGGTWAWVNVDATLPQGVAYDAAHILLSVSGLGEGEMQNFLVTTAPLIGRLKIGVVHAE
ncbi:MAG: transglutaminase-like domain-containing protein [Phycisphaerales bacterium]|nr:transglutaminase-like domain-containing protein [Phycisphaerales bacterium]